MKQIDESYDGREIEATVGRSLEISLPENPTTGFAWHLDADGEPVCTLESDSYEPPSGKVVGQAGRHIWQFRAKEKGEAHIKLASRRAWETDAASSQTFTLKVRV